MWLEIPADPEYILLALGAGLLGAKLYDETINRPPVTVFAQVGYALCDVKEFSGPANLGSEGVSDDTATALSALNHPPDSDPEELARWSLRIGELLRQEAELREALDSAILRKNFTPATLEIYCDNKDKPRSELGVEAARIVRMIERARGNEP